MVGIVAGAALTAAKNVSVSKLAEGLGSLFGGQTATDRERASHAAGLLHAAMSGDMAALRQLAYEAYEKRTGLPGDSRMPRDGKYSPEAVRRLARHALQEYVRGGGTIPATLSQYADLIGAPIEPERVSGVRAAFDPVIQTIGNAAVDAAAARAQEKARSAVPYVAVALVVGVVLFVALSRRT